MRILIMGAGGLGAYFGGSLAHAGHDVTFVARGAQLDALRSRGLELRIGEERVHVPRVKAFKQPAEAASETFDVVLFAVKTYDTAAAIEALRPVVGRHPAVVTVQNGIDSIDQLEAAFGTHHVVAAPAYIFSAVTQPGVVETSGQRRLVLAELAGGSPTPRLETIATALREIGAQVTLSTDARLALWDKFVPLATFATISGACQLPLGMIRDIPEGVGLFGSMLREAVAVGQACGVALTSDLAESALNMLMHTTPASATSSMQRDLAAQRRVELEDLTGAVVRRGKEHSVPTPGYDALYAVLKVRTLSFGRPGS
jgi:2-dehydropantoate 2-reductase